MFRYQPHPVLLIQTDYLSLTPSLVAYGRSTLQTELVTVEVRVLVELHVHRVAFRASLGLLQEHLKCWMLQLLNSVPLT